MKWVKKYLKEITAETYTFVGLLIAYFTLEGSARKITGMIIILGLGVWLLSLPLRDDDEQMSKKIQVGTDVHVKTTAGRIRHAIVKTVTNQNSLSVQIGKGTAFSVTRANSTTTRGTQFNQ